MGRGKLRMELITNERKCKAVYANRIKGLMKKASELHTLCGVDVLLLSYFRLDGPVETWPEDPHEASRIAARFGSLSEPERTRWQKTVEDYLLGKDVGRQEPMQEGDTAKSCTMWDDQRLNDLSAESVLVLVAALDAMLARANERIELLKKEVNVKSKEVVIYEPPESQGFGIDPLLTPDPTISYESPCPPNYSYDFGSMLPCSTPMHGVQDAIFDYLHHDTDELGGISISHPPPPPVGASGWWDGGHCPNTGIALMTLFPNIPGPIYSPWLACESQQQNPSGEPSWWHMDQFLNLDPEQPWQAL